MIQPVQLTLTGEPDDMIPQTKNNLSAMACISAMQKFIRRGKELEAMRAAVELHHTSKNFATMVCNRLEIISHEDIDIILAPSVVPFVKAACDQARAWYDPKKLGKSRMAIGNAIRLMCRAPKSREGDHFHVATGLAELLEHHIVEIPDWVHDQHTPVGKRKGRGLQYFREVSTQLHPKPVRPDVYEDEAYRLWGLKVQLLAQQKADGEEEE